MLIDFSKIRFNSLGSPETPVLRLETLAGEVIGTIPHVFNLSFEINYSSLSQIQFDVARWTDGKENSIYDRLTGHKIIFTEALGIYVLLRPEISGDGLSEIKHITGYSIEQLRENKKLFLEEGTYNFWDPSLSNDDTVLGRILEMFPGWRAGSVDPRFIGKYRTFDSYDEDVLKFCYEDASEIYRCVFVFDVYKKLINVYSADDSRGSIPIYLGYDNLVESANLTELSDEVKTKLHFYGEDGLTITPANPMGTDYLIDLSWYVENGDLDYKCDGSTMTLAGKYLAWKRDIQNHQEQYVGIASSWASAKSEVMADETKLQEAENELQVFVTEQSTCIQSFALETNQEGKDNRQAELDGINKKIQAKENEIKSIQSQIEQSKQNADVYYQQIKAITDMLSFEGYFTEDEQAILTEYLFEDSVTEETFVASDISAGKTGRSSLFDGTVSLTGSTIAMTQTSDPEDRKIFAFESGKLTGENAAGHDSFSGDVIRGTLETRESTGECVLSIYFGSTTMGEKTNPSSTLTIRGIYSAMGHDVGPITQDGITENKGTRLSVHISPATADDQVNQFYSASVTEYQRYSVARELYDFGMETIADASRPTFEFSIDSANFIFLQEFAPFRDALDLGKAVYVNLRQGESIEANIIGLTISYEDLSSLALTFSNRFKKRDGIVTLEGMIKNSYSSASRFEGSRFTYNRVVDHSTLVDSYINGNLNAAVQRVIAASNQSVIIDGAGIHVEEDSADGKLYGLRIVNDMIAMTDDGWSHAKLAIGRFFSEDTGGYHYAVNADVIAGRILIGTELVLESQAVTGSGENITKQFRFDSMGAWLNNATFVIQNNTGCILIHPEYGIVGGTNDLFTTKDTEVNPCFVDEHGNIMLDDDGFPTNSAKDPVVNFYLDLKDGNAYFRGKIISTSGSIGGWKIEEGKLFSGSGESHVELNTSDPIYAQWAGADEAANAPFWVKRNGEMRSTKVKILSADMSDDASEDDGWLVGCGIKVGKSEGAQDSDPEEGRWNFFVDKDGNVTMKGNINLADGAITWAEGESPITELPDYIKQTYIDRAKIMSPTIYGGYYYATGQGAERGAAYYITDGFKNDGTDGQPISVRDPIGWISFDTSGAGTTYEAKERVIFRSINNIPIKIMSGGDMSLGCDTFTDVEGKTWDSGMIFFDSPIAMKSNVTYGTSLPDNESSRPGQLFFLIAG